MDVGIFWEGMLAGYGIAIPVGAISILIVDIGLRQGFGQSFAAGAGAASADFIFAALAALAGEALAEMLTPYATGLRISSAAVLLALGGYGLWQSQRISTSQQTKVTGKGNPRRIRTYANFLGLTLLNPLTIAYFGALILGGSAGSISTTAQRASFVIGAALASLSWQSFIAGLGALGRQHLSPQFQKRTSFIGNLVVMGLGIRILVAG